MWPVGLDIQPEMLRDNREVLRLDEGLEQHNSCYTGYFNYIHHNHFARI